MKPEMRKRIIGYAIIIIPLILVAWKWQWNGIFGLSMIGLLNCHIFEEEILPHL